MRHETITVKGFRVGPLTRFFNGFRGKPRVFLSFDHERDREWFEKFNRLFSDAYGILAADAMEQGVQRGDLNYRQRRTVRKCVAGTSATIVLCGTETFKREGVDWVIHCTLLKCHGLLGIMLPPAEETARRLALLVSSYGFELDWNKFLIPPAALWSNLITGYAHWISWTTDPRVLSAGLEEANRRAGKPWLIFNNPEMIVRDLR